MARKPKRNGGLDTIENQTACADFPNVVAQRHIFGLRTQGLWPPNSNSSEIFVQCTYPQVSSSCLLVRKLSYWQTNKQTNKQTHKQTENIYATTLGK